jgi:uncharacterized protein (DUF58 family)
MHTRDEQAARKTILDKRRLQAIGVLLPIRLNALSFLPGRHPLGRAGQGMRFLRNRAYEPGEDNPRDIDKFSPPDKLWINEWEAEVQASINLFCDNSASMSFPPKAAVRNLALMQLTYSLWRACDLVSTVFFSKDNREQFAERNLKTQLEKLTQRIASEKWAEGIDVIEALEQSGMAMRGMKSDITFLISDFAPVTAGDDAGSTQRWRAIIRRIPGDLVPVIISFNLPRDVLGMVKLWDPERNTQRMTLMTPGRIDRINEKERLRVDRLESFFRKLGVDYLLLRQERDVYPQLARLTGLRRKRK